MDFLRHVRDDAAALSAAARSAPTAAVPSCPDWDMAQLVGHVGGVHRWVAGMVRSRATERGPFPEPPDDDLLAWFDAGAEELTAVLADIGPDDLVWNWADRAPAPARFWPRRMAHETAMHRWDAQNAARPGTAEPIDEALARDGIDEYLGFVTRWLGRRPVDGLEGTLGLATARPCTVVLHPDHLDVVDGLDQAGTVVTASTSDVLLFLVGRAPAPPGTEGDQSVLSRWAASVVFS